MTSNLVVNLNKIRAANSATRPESSVVIFDYFAPESAAGEQNQRPLVRVVNGSLRRSQDGEWMFTGVNLFRIDENTRSVSGATRTYRLDRINGLVRSPA